MDAATRVKSATGKPSSRMNPAVRYSGVAPVADVPAGEEERRHHVGVGGKREPGLATASDAAESGDAQLGGVLKRFEQRIAERVEEDGLDQRVRRLAAGAVRHGDPLFPDPRVPSPRPVDAVKHLLLAVSDRQRRASVRVLRPLRVVVLTQRLLDPARAGGPGAGGPGAGGHDLAA
jgi:hypothetical protein